MKNLTKQLVLIAKGILKLDDSQRNTLGGWIITYIRIRVRDVSWRLAHEAKADEVTLLALGLLILLWARGVIAGEVEVTEGSTHMGHHLSELLLVPKAVLLLALALIAGVILVVVVVILVGGLELLLLGAVSDEVGGVTALEAAPRWSPPLLAEPVQVAELVIPVVVVVLVVGVGLLPLGTVGDEVGGVTTLKAAPRWSLPLLAEPVQAVELSCQQGDLIVSDALVLLIRSGSQRGQSKL
jgi:hypothetical protein